MKKAIAILVVVVIALVGLTSYNTNNNKKQGGDDTILAQLKTSSLGEPSVPSGPNKKLD